MFIGLGSGFFADNAIFIHPSHEIMLDTEFGVPTLFKLLPFIFTILFSVIYIILSEYLPTILVYFKLSRVGYNIFSFFNQRFLIELFYNKYVTGVVLKLGGHTTKVLDKGSIEYIGPHGLEKGLLNISNNIGRLSTGVITSYALYILVSLVFYMLFYAYLNGAIFIVSIVLSSSLVLKDSYNSPNVILQSNLGKMFKLYSDKALYILYSRTWKNLLHILVSFIVFSFIRRPISIILYAVLPWYFAFILAYLIGCIISYFSYSITNTLFNKSKQLDNYIYNDVVDLVNNLFPGYLLVSTTEMLIAKKYLENSSFVKEYPIDVGLKLARQKKNAEMARKLEILAGAMRKDGSDPRHGALSDVLFENSLARREYIKSLFKEEYLWAKQKDDANHILISLMSINNPEMIRESGPHTSSELNEIRNIWRDLGLNPSLSKNTPSHAIPSQGSSHWYDWFLQF